MVWSIVWTNQAAQDLSRLDPPVARRILRKLEQAASDPLRFFHRLVGVDDSKLRVGDYRVLAVMNVAQHVVVVERIDHRSRVYKRRP